MTRLWTTLALSLAATSPAFAQSAGNDNSKNTNPSDPIPLDIDDRAGTDLGDPADATTPTPVEVDTTATSALVTPEPAPAIVAATRETTYVTTTERERSGIALAVGAGTSDFTGDTMRGTTNMGGDWDVRLTIGTRSPLALEASYIGSAQRINSLGLENNAYLVSNGLRGALRLNATINSPVQPFIFGGVGWRRYDLRNTTNATADVASKDDVMEFPAGVGLAGRFSGLMLDVRGEYDYTTNADMVRTTDQPFVGQSSSNFGTMHRWGANINVGYEF